MRRLHPSPRFIKICSYLNEAFGSEAQLAESKKREEVEVWSRGTGLQVTQRVTIAASLLWVWRVPGGSFQEMGFRVFADPDSTTPLHLPSFLLPSFFFSNHNTITNTDTDFFIINFIIRHTYVRHSCSSCGEDGKTCLVKKGWKWGGMSEG